MKSRSWERNLGFLKMNATKSLRYFWVFFFVLGFTGKIFAREQPIELVFDSGTTNFARSGSGTANFMVHFKSFGAPESAALSFSLKDSGAQSGLDARLITTGPSTCSASSTLCGSHFILKPGQSCCLAFTLSAHVARDYKFHPVIGSQPLAYAAEPQSDVIVSVFPSIYALTSYQFTYTPDGGASWWSMLNQPLVNNGNFTVNSAGVVYFPTSGFNHNDIVHSTDGINWNVLKVTYPDIDLNDATNTISFYQNQFVVGTQNGYILASKDQGQTWKNYAQLKQDDNPVAVSTSYVDASGLAYVGGSDGKVFYSKNGEKNIKLPSVDGSPVIGIAVTVDGTIYAVTETTASSGSPYYYENGTWIQMPALPHGSRASPAIAAFASTVYVGTDSGEILSTKDKGASWQKLINKPDGSAVSKPIINLFIDSSENLSPLFARTAGIVSVGESWTSIAVKNLSSAAVNNAHAILPDSWPAVIQDPSDCAGILAPNASCNLRFRAQRPYSPKILPIVGSESSRSIDSVALAFSVSDDLVYYVDNQNAYVIDSADAAGAPQVWSQSLNSITGITEADNGTTSSRSSPSGCLGAIDGSCNTKKILNFYQVPYDVYAAGLCYLNTTGPVARGTWYLPSVCELSAGYYFNYATGGIELCSSTGAQGAVGLLGLYAFGLLPNILSDKPYFSSTVPYNQLKSRAFSLLFKARGGIFFESTKTSTSNIRCVRRIII